MAAEPSYIDYEAFLDPDFSPASFANSLVVATNNATDTPLDLSTPLSRVLFDLQEIDTHIHTLTTKSALPLLTHTEDQTAAASKILKEADEQIASVSQGYERLEREVLRKWEAAEEARVATENSLATVRLARAVARCVALGRQLDGQMMEVTGRGGLSGAGGGDGTASPGPGRDDNTRALERAASTIVSLRRLLSDTGVGEEGNGLDRVKVIRTLKSDLLIPAENLVKARAQQAINRFSISTSNSSSNGATAQSSYKQARDARARLISGVNVLYLLSPLPSKTATTTTTATQLTDFHPELLLSTLQGYIQTTTVASLNNLSRGLTMLPTLDRTLPEISARSQDIHALEAILSTIKPPTHPSLPQPQEQTSSSSSSPSPNSNPKPTNLLTPLLTSLDTPSLPSYFWRSLASSLSSRIQEIIHRGGVSARTLRSNRDKLKKEIRECVLRGSQLPQSAVGVGMEKRDQGQSQSQTQNWEREAAVMVSAVVGVLER